MKFLYYCNRNNEYLCSVANINVNDVINMAESRKSEHGFAELAIPINKLLPEDNNEYENRIFVVINSLIETVTVERRGYSYFKDEYITEEVEEAKISKSEIITLLAYEKVYSQRRFNLEIAAF